MTRIELSDNDVVSMESDKNFANTPTSKIETVLKHFKSYVHNSYAGWFQDGVNCEVMLTSGGGWRKGKVKVEIVFIPDEPHQPMNNQFNGGSVLDDLRQKLNREPNVLDPNRLPQG